MTPNELLAFMRTHRVAVEALVSEDAGSQAAVVGIAITDRFEVVGEERDRASSSSPPLN